MKRTFAVAVAAVALPLLAACSGSGAPDPTTGAPVTSDAAPATSDAPVIAGGDEFCDLAVDARGVAEQVEELTAGMTTTIGNAIASGDISVVNAWGAELSALDEQMLQFYADGRPYIEGEEVEGAWNLMEQFTRDYSLAVASEAAVATDTADFTTKMGAIVSDPGIQAAVNFGPAAAESVGTYIEERCGV